jgi:CheY-like chemotaxis protein
MEALRFLELGSSCDAILSDVTMPEMDGVEFAQRVIRARADLAGRIVLMTGDARFSRASGLPVLGKPLDFAALRALLARFGSAPP